ncbi:MAG: lysophospholipid acyltransferase family protein [Minisyncoccia bacterium]
MYPIYAIFERIVWLFIFISTRFFCVFNVIGRENIKNLPRPLMIIANHQTFFDPVIIGTVFPFFSKYIPIAFMVDDRYYHNPFLKIFFKLTYTFPSHYGQGLDVSLKKPRRVLRDRGVFLIFPSGERHRGGPAPRPKRGAAVLALETPNLTILPVWLKIIKRKITVVIGQSFKLREITSSHAISEVALALSEEIFKLENRAQFAFLKTSTVPEKES